MYSLKRNVPLQPMFFSLKYCYFSLNFASSAAALVFYLPCVCTQTDTEEKQRKARVRNIRKIFGKKPQYLLNAL